jgi:hypothetical protein
MTNPNPNVRLRLSLPAQSASFGPQIRVLAHVAPSGREHGPQWTVAITEIQTVDIHGTYVFGTVTEAALDQSLAAAAHDNPGKRVPTLAEVKEMLVDRYLANQPKARKSTRAA